MQIVLGFLGYFCLFLLAALPFGVCGMLLAIGVLTFWEGLFGVTLSTLVFIGVQWACIRDCSKRQKAMEDTREGEG